MEDILLPNEIEVFIDTMAPQSMINLGTVLWLDWHQRLQKLNQQALIEASALKEEQVKETLVSFQKVPILIHESILINIWKHKVLPHLLKLEPHPESTFIAYSILYHEGICVALLELIMYHASCCEALEDSAVDLLDYVSGTVSQLLNASPNESAEMDETSSNELIRQRNNLTFEIGIRCLGILRYLSENSERLPITVVSNIYGTHDIPVLLTEIIMRQPWIRQGKQYSAGKWREWDGEQLGQSEAQVWLTLRHILLDPECPNYYPITEGRRAQLTKLLPVMRPSLLDQLSPLFELKQWLCRLSCLEKFAAPPKPILLEAVLEIKGKILQECGGKWKKMAEKQVANIFTDNRERLQETAKKLTEAYNTDFIEKFEVKESQVCSQCGQGAIQRCSRCQKSWYCSRKCQVDHWPQHKEDCERKSSTVNTSDSNSGVV